MGIIGILNNGYLGLTGQSKSLGSISQNIANARTDGYKDQDTLFHTLLGADVTSASNISRSPVLGGGEYGVAADVRYNTGRQGSLRVTGESTNVAVDGKGWFIVRDPDTAPAAEDGGLRYTRAGDFSVNGQGKLQGSNGFLVQGVPVDGSSPGPQVSSGALSDIQVPFDDETGTFLTHAKATGSITIGGSLSTDAAPAQPPTLASTNKTNIEIYDSLGRSFTLTLGFSKIAGSADGTASTWATSILGMTQTDTGETVSGPAINPADPATWTPVGTLKFDRGNLAGASGNAEVVGDATQLSFDIDLSAFAIAGQAFGAESPAQTAKLGTASFGTQGSGMLRLHIGEQNTETGLREDLTGGPAQTYLLTQDGYRESGFTGLEIGADGLVSAMYQSSARVPLAQLPVAQFRNEGGLMPLSGTVYGATSYSGDATLAVAGASAEETEGQPFPALVPEAVEESTVELTDQFTRLIQTQRVYSANSKVVTTADELWQTAIQTAG